MNKLMVLFVLVYCVLIGSHACANPFKVPVNTLQVGNGSASDKALTFNIGSGASNPKLSWDNTNSGIAFNKSSIIIGNNDGTSDVCLVFKDGDVSAPSWPKMCWDESSSELQFSNDGVSFAAIGSGGGGGGSTADWFVESAIAGSANANLTTSAVAGTAVHLTNTGLTLSNSAVSGAVTANIACVDGESPAGTTCTGAEAAGISFTVPNDYTGPAEVCSTFAHFVTLSSGSGLAANLVRWGIYKTAESTSLTVENSAISIAQFYVNMEREASDQDFNDVMSVCTVFHLTASEVVTFRMMYTKNANHAGVSANGVQLTGGAVMGFRVKPLM